MKDRDGKEISFGVYRRTGDRRTDYLFCKPDYRVEGLSAHFPIWHVKRIIINPFSSRDTEVTKKQSNQFYRLKNNDEEIKRILLLAFDGIESAEKKAKCLGSLL